MCGRYFIGAEPLSVRDVCPGDEAPVLLAEGSELVNTSMRWGFERTGGGLVINARIESIHEKPMFKGLAQNQRCVLPASGYYEWRGGDRQKFSIFLEEGNDFYLAGLYRVGASGREFVVLTQPPVSKIRPIHSRMPLLLDSREAMMGWLLEGKTPLYADDGRLRVNAQGSEQLKMTFL